MGFYSVNQIITDAKNRGVEILPICINNSSWDNTIERNEKNNLRLRIGFRQIKGLSRSVIKKLISVEYLKYCSDLKMNFNTPIKHNEKLIIYKRKIE